jgi:glycosyltransferase involved in cell wall biosynthesis
VRVAFNLLDAGIGGGQRVAAGVAEALVAAGHEIGLAVPGEGPAVGWFTDGGAQVELVDLLTLRRPSGIAKAARFFSGYDLVYSHTSTPGIILAGAAASRARVPHVIHQHTHPYFSERLGARRFQRMLYARAARSARTIAVAQHVADAASAAGAPPDRIVVIPNGVEIPPPAVEQPRSGEITIGMLGRLDHAKGIDIFLDAVEHIETPARFALGTPAPESELGRLLHQRAKALDVRVSAPASAAFLEGIDIVAVPSRAEGHPLTLMEAMARGRPVVATSIRGITEMMDGEPVALLVPPEDPRALAGALDTLALDEALRTQLGQRARAFVAARYALPMTRARVVQFLERASR